MREEVNPYSFSEEFEIALVAAICNRPKLYSIIGCELDASCMVTSVGKLVIEACHDMVREHNSSPKSSLLLIQYLCRKVHEGSMTKDQLNEIDEIIGNAEDAGLPGDTEIIEQVSPILKRRLQLDAIKIAHKTYATNGDFNNVLSILDKAEKIGKVAFDESSGIKLGGNSFSIIEEVHHYDRMPLGIDELDASLGGGTPRGSLAMYIGASGDGKSMALSHATANACRHGMFVAYATLELPPSIVLARLKSNHTGIPINEIMSGSTDAKHKLEKNPPAGPCYVKSFTPQISTVSDIKDWVEELEDIEGRCVDSVVVDYADKLTAKAHRDINTYDLMNIVYEQYRVWMSSSNKWGLTASQSTRSSANRLKDSTDVADSIHKIRVVDLAVTLNYDVDDETMRYVVAKCRYGRAHQVIGPIPTDFKFGRMVPCSIYDENDLGGYNAVVHQ